MKTFLIKLSEILKAAVTKFSMINIAQYFSIATVIIGTYVSSSLISPSESLIITGVITLIYKYWESSKQLVQTGFNMDWTIYLSGLISLTIGVLDTFVTQTSVLESIFGEKSRFVIMGYLALTIIFRTGFSNQNTSKG